jgi:predicted SAM-dependent methyltransferase
MTAPIQSNSPLSLSRRVLHKLRTIARVTRALLQSDSSDGLQHATSTLLAEARIAQASRRADAAFSAIKASRHLKLHLGCGRDVRPGWVNIDLWNQKAARPDAETFFIQYDLRQGLPVVDECSSFIYSSHFFEHLDYDQAVRLFEDCYHALEPGGIFRIALPSFKMLFQAYLEDDPARLNLLIPRLPPRIRDVSPEVIMLIDHISHSVFEYGEHKHLYDEDKIMALLNAIGYSAVRVSTFQAQIDVNDPLRQQYSFYIEATK